MMEPALAVFPPEMTTAQAVTELRALVKIAFITYGYVTDAGDLPGACEFAIVIADAWQGRGIGRHLMEKLIRVARSRGIPSMHGEILSINHGMLMMVKKLGFRTERHPEDGTVVRAVLELHQH